ncbi:CGNR zinc finger domain-containing protein [Thermosporothrix hazakensis]|uniref:CGNR zinc finger domain-containing protein n=1 Tax=Thermosporothrix hazakensis TaxID=644383 RepID=UPI003530EF8C
MLTATLHASARPHYQARHPFTLKSSLRQWSRFQLHEGESPILSTIALAAFQLLTEYDLTRLRACQNPACPLFFYDTTKSATRHWCSVKCKERARSIVRHRQSKQA